MRKIILLIVIFVSIPSSWFMPCVYGSCDNNEPEWYMDEDPKCRIYPFYYVANVSAEESADGVYNTGTCVEYWDSSSDDSPSYQIICGDIESTYSGGGDFPLYCNFFQDRCDSTWWSFHYGDDYSSSGGWSGTSYSSTSTIDTDSGYHYSTSVSMSAIFNRGAPLNACSLGDPVVTISNYERMVYVRPKNRGCCKAGGTQVITMSCNEAVHTKITVELDGDAELATVDPNNTLYGCSGNTHYSSGKITIIPNHDKIIFDEDNPLSLTVTYTVTFFDKAGNSIGVGSASVAFAMDCPEEPE